MNYRIALTVYSMFCLVILGTFGTAGAAMRGEAPAILNADFAEWDGERPEGWTFRKNQQVVEQATGIDGASAATALHVKIVDGAGGKQGEILQKLDLEPYTRYRFTGDLRSSPGGGGFYQIKTIRSKSELERLSSDESTEQWKNVSIEFDTQGADEVQVLCRYDQKAGDVGAEVWWTGMKLEKVGEGAAPPDPNRLSVAGPGSDQYVTPGGSGGRGGSGWDDARPGDELAEALKSAGPGDTVYIASGTYPKIELTLDAGGSGEDGRVTLKGVDTGGGLPRFVSDFDKDEPNAAGGVFLTLQHTVGFISVEDIRLEGFKIGLDMYGPNRGVRVRNLDVAGGREGIIVNGGAIAHQPGSGTSDLVIEDCEFGPYTKRGIRIRDGVSDVRIVNCHADAGGREWATERFAVGFAIQGSKADGIKDRNIRFENCTARNHVDPNGDEYWNADGFTAERNVDDVTYTDCAAFDNTDGGWDVKATNVKLVNCISLRNKRNFRVWSSPEGPAELVNCLGAYSHKYGGSGNANGLHLAQGAHVTATRCTFAFNGESLDLDSHNDNASTASLTLVDSLVYEPKGQVMTTEGPADSLTTVDSQLIGTEGLASPDFVNPHAEYEGGSDAFESRTFPNLGYRHEPQ